MRTLAGEGITRKTAHIHQYLANESLFRVGETGQVKTMDFDDLALAKEEFGKKFKSKTGLEWENRDDEPKAKKYTYIERAYEDEEDDEDDAKSDEGYSSGGSVKSELPISTQRLMELIFK
jgi:poly [ADP-ribose] polymerase